MAEVRQRKPAATPAKGASKPTQPPPQQKGLSTGTLLLGILAITSATGIAIAGSLHFLDPLKYFNLPSAASSAAAAASSAASSSSPSSAPGHLVLTDAQLARHDGSDPSIPLYIAINGTIYDVSSGRSFYGPGGPYAHFAGRDATRAWVTECFEGPEQWTHDMRGVHEMFMPKYMDETLEEAAAGKSADVGEGEAKLPEEMMKQAQAAVKKIGKVSSEEKERRRVRDEEEAQKGVEKALKHWVDFFGGSGKYELVGKVERDQKAWEQAAPDPPKLCEKALKKKPVKGGKLEAAMGSLGKMMGGTPGAPGTKGANAKVGEVPDFVKAEKGSS